MKKKFLILKGGKGNVSYGVIVPKTLLELLGCDLEKMNKTTVDIKLDSKSRKITISDPQIKDK